MMQLSSSNHRSPKSPQWFAVPASLQTLLHRPWTVLSYMFLHESLLHIFLQYADVLFLAVRSFMEYLGNRKLVATYLFGGIFGAILLYCRHSTYFPSFRGVVGPISSSGRICLSYCCAGLPLPLLFLTIPLIWFFLGRVKLKYIAIIFVAIDLLSIEKSQSPADILLHLGGASVWASCISLH